MSNFRVRPMTSKESKEHRARNIESRKSSSTGEWTPPLGPKKIETIPESKPVLNWKDRIRNCIENFYKKAYSRG